MLHGLATNEIAVTRPYCSGLLWMNWLLDALQVQPGDWLASEWIAVTFGLVILVGCGWLGCSMHSKLRLEMG